MRNSEFAQLMSVRTNTGGHRQLSHVELPALCEQWFQERAFGFLFSGWIFRWCLLNLQFQLMKTEREISKFSLHCRVVPWTGAGLEALDCGAVSVHRGSHVTVQLFRISLEGLSLGKEI